MIDLKAKPFYLDAQDIEWVNSTLNGMTQKEKIAHGMNTRYTYLRVFAPMRRKGLPARRGKGTVRKDCVHERQAYHPPGDG